MIPPGICRDFKGLGFSAFCLVTEMQKGRLRDLLAELTPAEEPASPSSSAEVAKAPQPKKAIIRILCDMARGLAHLHKYNIVHRDVALRNFLVGSNGRVMVCDFGMSRQVGDGEDAYFRNDSDSALPVRSAIAVRKITGF